MALVGGELNWAGAVRTDEKTVAKDVLPTPKTLGDMGRQVELTARLAKRDTAAISTDIART